VRGRRVVASIVVAIVGGLVACCGTACGSAGLGNIGGGFDSGSPYDGGQEDGNPGPDGGYLDSGVAATTVTFVLEAKA
jgi:hypothetical protein